jgi:hypothetical protein
LKLGRSVEAPQSQGLDCRVIAGSSSWLANIVRNGRISAAARRRERYENDMSARPFCWFSRGSTMKRKIIKSLLNTKTIHGMVLKSRRP